jgi:NADH-quinone oxidoreductase subunit L
MVHTFAILIFALPALTFALMALSQTWTRRVVDKAAVIVMGACLGMSLCIFAKIWGSGQSLVYNLTFDWLPLSGRLTLLGGVMVDHLTAVMLVVVTGVSFLVFLFSTRYMQGDVRYGRYFCCLLLFSTSMLGLVLANNLLFLFVFWELVGLSSYLLIGHWFEKKSASNAAIKAFITTRIGDLGMFIGLMTVFCQTGSLQYADAFAAVASGKLAGGWQTLAGLGIFFGAMGKSAQFPLHVWLPDAMEGPTPVSALIHAATMVAAGVYLVGRMFPVFDEPTLLFIAYIGAFTALFAATIALVQDDIKKVLAYSTISQLGYMTMALGVGGYVSGLFHLTTHAFFKAGLFLGSGAVIYAMHHEQSLSKYGGLWKKLPKTAVCYLLFTLALAGFPGFSGFWSKDAILADVLSFSSLRGHYFIPVAGFSTVFLTAFYMFRQYFLTFTGKPRDHHAFEHAKEVPWQMLVPLMILAALSLGAGGFKGKWFSEYNPKKAGIEQVSEFSSLGYRSAQTSLALTLKEDSAAEPKTEEHSQHGSHETAMLLSVILALCGIGLSSLFYFERKDGTTFFRPSAIADRVKPLYVLLCKKYYLDELYALIIVRPALAFAAFCAGFDRIVIDSLVNLVGILGKLGAYLVELIDRLFVDGLGVNGLANITAWAGNRLSYIQSGYLRQYLYLLVLGVVTISIICIWMA